MIARDARMRSGITLVEILIAILIMGVGLISLATLFPLGLLRLREATRNSRGGLIYETAADDMDTRALFYKPSFTQTWYWTVNAAKAKVPRDPFVQDAAPDNTTTNVLSSTQYSSSPNYVGLDSGLPIAYDPLWRSITGVLPNIALSDPTLSVSYNSPYTADEARFGAGVFTSNLTSPYLRIDPVDNLAPSAHGLQRITNFVPWNNVSLTPQYPFTCQNLSIPPPPPGQLPNQPLDVSGLVFASNDDIVFNSFSGNPNSPSPLIPDMSVNFTPQADYRFTWFVTGRQTDAGGNGLQFTGEIVVCDGRPFGWDPIPGQSFNAPAGETVVEAIFGYGSNVPLINDNMGNSTKTGFATGADKTVLLRWPTTMADPQVRAGGWICDVTYERNVGQYYSRRQFLNAPYTGTPFVRCYWYQVGKRTDPQADVSGVVSATPYRSMVLTLTSPVRARTLLNSDGTPYHVNVALVMPSVINVFPRDFEVHPIAVP